MPIKEKSGRPAAASRSSQSVKTRTPEPAKGGSSTQIVAPKDRVGVSKEAREGSGPGGSVSRLAAGLGGWAGQTSGSQKPDTSAKPSVALEANEILRTGQGDPSEVKDLQEMLNDGGAELEVDGKFGPLTESAVREYQSANGLEVDGIVGPETLSHLNGSERAEGPSSDAESPTTVAGEAGKLSLADPNLSPQEQYEHYKSLLEANGGKLDADGPTVLGLRGLGIDGSRHDGTSNIGGYDDTFVVLSRDANGNPSVELFGGATHANQRTSGASVGHDMLGNTIRGVAMLAPGNYKVDYSSPDYKGRGPSYYVKTQNGNGLVPAFRDTNADGVISSAERQAAEAGRYTASAILFHGGFQNAPSSIGCQTMPPSVMRAFSSAVGRNGFSYTLLDANNSRLPL